MKKSLYRSENDRMLAGVMGGLADYFQLDATLLRLGFLVVMFFGVGTPLLIYIVAVFIVPNEWDVR